MTAPDDPLARARSLDRSDPLARVVEAFHPAAEGPAGRTIYLAGHDLGQQPHATANAVEREMRRWRQDLTAGAAERWDDLPGQVATALAAIVGGRPGQIEVGDATTIAVERLALALLDRSPDRRDVLVSESEPAAFVAALARCADGVGGKLRTIGAAPTSGMVTQGLDDSVGLLALSHVDGPSGALLDMAAVTDAAHRGGAAMLWECTRTAGTMPLDLDAIGVDGAVGSMASHLGGGPGAPGWSYRSEIDLVVVGPDVSPLLSLVGAMPGAQLVAGLDLSEVREKVEQLTQLGVALADAWLAPHGLQLVTPRRTERRAAEIVLRHPDALRIAQVGSDRLGVVTQAREPDLLVLGLSPLPLRYVDVVVAMRRLRDAIASGQHTR